MFDFIGRQFKRMNEHGVHIPLVRINGKATFTGTITLISFLTALLGQIGKISKFLGDVDLTQANYLFLICLGAYVGGKFNTIAKIKPPSGSKK